MDGEIKYALVRRVRIGAITRLAIYTFLFDTKEEAEQQRKDSARGGIHYYTIVEVRPMETTVVMRKWPD